VFLGSCNLAPKLSRWQLSKIFTNEKDRPEKLGKTLGQIQAVDLGQGGPLTEIVFSDIFLNVAAALYPKHTRTIGVEPQNRAHFPPRFIGAAGVFNASFCQAK